MDQIGDPEAVPSSTPGGDRIVLLMARAISGMSLYGLDHVVARASVSECFGALSAALGPDDRLSMSWPEAGIRLGGAVVSAKTSSIQGLLARLRELEVQELSFLKGLDLVDFEKLLIVICTQRSELADAGGILAVAESLGIRHVDFRKIRYAVLEDGQVVADGATTASEAPHPLNQLVKSFLRGGEGADERAALETALDDPDSLSRLIVESAVEHDPENLANRILTSVKRCYATLCAGDAPLGRKRRRQVVKTLESIRDASSETLPADTPQLGRLRFAAALDEMVDELSLESLAEDYTRKRIAIEEDERRVIRLMNSNGGRHADATRLRDRFLGAGLSEAQWVDLQRRGGAMPAYAESPEAEMEVPGSLSGMLTEVRRHAQGGDGGGMDRDRMIALLQQVDAEVGRLIGATTRRVHDLEVRLGDKSSERSGKSADEHRLVRDLAEIVQELMQPLSVIQCSIDMIKGRMLGGVPAIQGEILELASASTNRLEHMVRMLSRLSGLPESLTPEESVRRILSAGSEHAGH